MHAKKRLDDFSEARKHKKDILSMPLCRSLTEIKKLDSIAKNMITAVRKDKNIDERELESQVAMFEDEWLDEAKLLVKELQMGTNTLVMGIKNMTELKAELEKHTGKRHHLKPVFHQEIKLANTLMQAVHQKLDSMKSILSRMK